MNLKLSLVSLLTAAALFTSTISSAQTLALRFVPGFCNKVEATLSGVTTPALFTVNGSGFCSGTFVNIAGLEYKRFSFQLQKLVNGVFVDQGSSHIKVEQDVVYRDLTYGDTWRVKVDITLGNGIPSIHPYFGCSAVIGQSPGSGILTIFSNALDTEPANGLTDSDLSGVLQATNNFGGNGTSFAQRRKYCRSDVQGGVFYDVSSTHGPDHWAVNLTRTNLTGGWAAGPWHDYTPAKLAGSVEVFGEAWQAKYGTNSIWEGQYKVGMLGRQDCDNNSWAYHEDFFEIFPTGTAGCRLDVEETVADVVIYPNPSPSGMINYYTTGEEMEELNYTLYGINGQILKTGMLFGGTGQLDVGDLEAGLYIIEFQSVNKTLSKRLSITK